MRISSILWKIFLRIIDPWVIDEQNWASYDKADYLWLLSITHQWNDKDDEEDSSEVSLLGHRVPLTEVGHALLRLGLARGGEDEQVGDRGHEGEQPGRQDEPEYWGRLRIITTNASSLRNASYPLKTRGKYSSDKQEGII